MTPVIVRGDLSGREARRGTYASRPVRRDEPHSDFQSAGHGFCRAIFAPIAFARARGRLGGGLATRGCGALNSGQPVPINFLCALAGLSPVAVLGAFLWLVMR